MQQLTWGTKRSRDTKFLTRFRVLLGHRPKCRQMPLPISLLRITQLTMHCYFSPAES